MNDSRHMIFENNQTAVDLIHDPSKPSWDDLLHGVSKSDVNIDNESSRDSSLITITGRNKRSKQKSI